MKFTVSFLSLILLLPLLTVFHSSCSSDREFQESKGANEIILNSSLDANTFKVFSKNIEGKLAMTRGSTDLLSEEEAKELLLPLLTDGKNIRDQVLKSLDRNSVEYTLYSQMTDQDFILLSIISFSNLSQTETRALSELTGSQVLNCIGSAIGIPSGISGLKLSGLMTAKTGLQVLRTVATRYAFGYVALAIAVYQFSDCINDIAHVI